MIKPKKLQIGDKVAIVSLSSGILGEDSCRHQLELGIKRLRQFGLDPVFMPNALKGTAYLENHPEARASDLKQAFKDDSIKGIICAIGGFDIYRILPYLMADAEFRLLVRSQPKLFSGFSDTTGNHLMFYRLGLTTYYGPAFLTDLAELADGMLPYTASWFKSYFHGADEIIASDIWYEERTDFSENAIGQPRVAHQECHGFELLQRGTRDFQGKLLGGCLESLYEMLTDADTKVFCERYQIFPAISDWQNNILFIETSEVKPTPESFRMELLALKKAGIFDAVNGVIVGKPQNEAYYQEYRRILLETVADASLPILYNVNFGHAYPRCVVPYGISAAVAKNGKKIVFNEPLFAD